MAIIGGPLAFDLGGVLSPSIHDTGRASIAANAAANGIANAVHVAAFVVASSCSLVLPGRHLRVGYAALTCS